MESCTHAGLRTPCCRLVRSQVLSMGGDLVLWAHGGVGRFAWHNGWCTCQVEQVAKYVVDSAHAVVGIRQRCTEGSVHTDCTAKSSEARFGAACSPLCASSAAVETASVTGCVANACKAGAVAELARRRGCRRMRASMPGWSCTAKAGSVPAATELSAPSLAPYWPGG